MNPIIWNKTYIIGYFIIRIFVNVICCMWRVLSMLGISCIVCMLGTLRNCMHSVQSLRYHVNAVNVGCILYLLHSVCVLYLMYCLRVVYVLCVVWSASCVCCVCCVVCGVH